MIKPYYYRDGITIYNADCREVLPQLCLVDLVLTDPPYGLGKKLAGGTWNKAAAWDELLDITFLLDLAPKVVIWGGNYYPLPPSRGWLSWYKPDAVPSMAQFELAWTNQDRNARQISHSIAATNGERNGHPTQKPLRVMAWSITEMGLSSGMVLDPFMGSGTTLAAAQKQGLKAIGIEVNKEYCDIAIERLRQPSLLATA